jgi:hypothetical protein
MTCTSHRSARTEWRTATSIGPLRSPHKVPEQPVYKLDYWHTRPSALRVRIANVHQPNVSFGSLADAATMSALSPVQPDKRTSAHVSGASARCQKQTSEASARMTFSGGVLQKRICHRWLSQAFRTRDAMVLLSPYPLVRRDNPTRLASSIRARTNTLPHEYRLVGPHFVPDGQAAVQ